MKITFQQVILQVLAQAEPTFGWEASTVAREASSVWRREVDGMTGGLSHKPGGSQGMYGWTMNTIRNLKILEKQGKVKRRFEPGSHREKWTLTDSEMKGTDL